MFQASKCRRHYKSNLGRKRGWFKKGNSIRGTIRDSNLQNSGNANVEPSGSGFQRLSSEDAQEVAYANITAAPETTLPFKLRPTAPGDEGETVSRNEASSGSDENIIIIVSLKKLSELCEYSVAFLQQTQNIR